MDCLASTGLDSALPAVIGGVLAVAGIALLLATTRGRRSGAIAALALALIAGLGIATLATPTAAHAACTTAPAAPAVPIDPVVPAVGIAPAFTTTAYPVAARDAAYSYTLATTGDAPITFAVVTGALPAGLALDPTTGTIAGISTVSGTVAFTVSATNATGTASFDSSIVTVLAPTITTTAPSAYTPGGPYSFTLAATGDPTLLWAITVGVLPSGLTMSAQGVISGTTTGTAETFTVTATNSAGTSTKQLTLSPRVSQPFPF